MDLSNYIPGFVTDHGPNVLMYLGAAIAGLAVVSPLTKSNVDNKVLDVLRWVVAFGGKVVGHKERPASSIRDHRNGK
jgi:hypothetical protein